MDPPPAISLIAFAPLTLSKKQEKDGVCALVTTLSMNADPPHTAPIAYSAAIDIQTGRVFRCTFANKPDNIIRHMKLTFNPIDEDDCDSQNIYDSDKGIICIKAFTLDKRRARVEFLEGWINVPDRYGY